MLVDGEVDEKGGDFLPAHFESAEPGGRRAPDRAVWVVGKEWCISEPVSGVYFFS